MEFKNTKQFKEYLLNKLNKGEIKTLTYQHYNRYYINQSGPATIPAENILLFMNSTLHIKPSEEKLKYDPTNPYKLPYKSILKINGESVLILK